MRNGKVEGERRVGGEEMRRKGKGGTPMVGLHPMPKTLKNTVIAELN